ncbi:MAG: ATPase, T2SS/T4P/T4SS family [Promethearchaeota archaeon]
MPDKFACDTSVIFNGRIIDLIEDGDLGEHPEIYISNIVVAEVEYRTNIQKEIGFFGLNVLKSLRQLHNEGKITLHLIGHRPTRNEIKMAPGGELDSLIRSGARENDAILITADRIQGDVGIFEGMEIMRVKEKRSPSKTETSQLKILDYFEENTMSIHLKRGLPANAKKGSPGNWFMEQVGLEIINKKLIEEIAMQIVEYVREDPHSFLEIQKFGAVVAQLREFRIVITRPPFSKDIEITAVRPLVNLTLKDYTINNRLKKRLSKAEGILVAGSPGAGKSTFSAALANFYSKQDRIVKTLESVRDLQVDPEITQYTKLEGSLENSADILLLVRPDFTIFDEVRTTKDFQIFSDFRLSGVGMVGVVHSASAIDAVQRFIGRIELGMLPSIIDTIIFIEAGDIAKVLTIKMTVKVPHGFRDKDLARPVIEVRDFLTNDLEYEMYSFGSDIVVNPINPSRSKRQSRFDEYNHHNDNHIQLDIQVFNQKVKIRADQVYASKNIVLYSGDRLIFSGSLSRNAEMSLSLSSKDGRKVAKEFNKNMDIYGKLK